MIEQRLECACADTASLALSPPTYPVALDTYQTGYVATVAESYGFMPITSAGPGVAVPYIPVGATITLILDQSNTTLCGVSAGGAVWSGGPGQIITVPGNFVTAAITVSGYTNALAVQTTAAFNATLAWYL